MSNPHSPISKICFQFHDCSTSIICTRDSTLVNDTAFSASICLYDLFSEDEKAPLVLRFRLWAEWSTGELYFTQPTEDSPLHIDCKNRLVKLPLSSLINPLRKETGSLQLEFQFQEEFDYFIEGLETSTIYDEPECIQSNILIKDNSLLDMKYRIRSLFGHFSKDLETFRHQDQVLSLLKNDLNNAAVTQSEIHFYLYPIWESLFHCTFMQLLNMTNYISTSVSSIEFKKGWIGSPEVSLKEYRRIAEVTFILGLKIYYESKENVYSDNTVEDKQTFEEIPF